MNRVYYPVKPFRISLLGPMSLAILGLGILLSELNNLIQYFLPAPQWLIKVFQLGGAWGFILIAVVAPLTEELLFRGLILRGFLSNYGV